MSARVPAVAANWKMHKTRPETSAFLDAFIEPAAERLAGVELVICPPFTSLETAVARCAATAVKVAAQNMHFEPQGAFTGELSAQMLVEVGVDAVVLGHSERRRLFGETDEALARKVPAALDAGLIPILCVGETLADREGGRTEEVLRSQVEEDLADVGDAHLGGIVIAYEPVWAIGTGRNATAEQAAEAIAFIRSLIETRDASASEAVRILYGGSVKPDNAAELLGPETVDGALVGGASLEPGDFLKIAAASSSR
ncbi:MAG: triose-phosphate isomerase [Solirubrobacterales bacterium]